MKNTNTYFQSIAKEWIRIGLHKKQEKQCSSRVRKMHFVESIFFNYHPKIILDQNY